MSRQFLARVGFSLALGLAAGAVALSGESIASEDLPPGIGMVAAAGFVPPDGLGPFQAMTLVLEVAPGSEIPMHSHPGKGQVILLSGEITLTELNGKEIVYHAGDVWIEEAGNVHKGTNKGAETARLVWTVLHPEGTELTELHQQ
jgi:quercetin dioxygenase-like cupin family protein